MRLEGRCRRRRGGGALGVLKDECGANTSLHRLYAWSRRGERVPCSAPRNWGANVTLLASMSLEGMGPCLAVEGPTTKAVFETYVERGCWHPRCGHDRSW